MYVVFLRVFGDRELFNFLFKCVLMFCDDKIANLSNLKIYIISNSDIFKEILFDYCFTLLIKGDCLFVPKYAQSVYLYVVFIILYAMLSFYLKFKAGLMI